MNRAMRQKIFIISLAGNFILITVLAVRRPIISPSVSTPVAAVRHETVEVQTALPEISPALATNMAQLVQWLRADHVSSSLLARLAVADFDERWDEQARRLQERFANGEIDETAMAEFTEQHDLEREKELRA